MIFLYKQRVYKQKYSSSVFSSGDIVVEISNHDGRIRRSNDELKQLTVKFNISSDAISFYLTHSKDIDTDVPIYTMNNAGKLELQQVPQLRVCF